MGFFMMQCAPYWSRFGIITLDYQFIFLIKVRKNEDNYGTSSNLT